MHLLKIVVVFGLTGIKKHFHVLSFFKVLIFGIFTESLMIIFGLLSFLLLFLFDSFYHIMEFLNLSFMGLSHIMKF
jgi:hypothetical protein